MSSSKPTTFPPRILQIPRSDEPNAYVLVHVTRSGTATLDLQLVATEGEDPYVGSVEQSRLNSLRAKGYQGSDDDWAQILSYVLGQSSSFVNKPDFISGIEVSATVSDEDEDKKIAITIRKRIETITQRLGSITLNQDDEQTIQLFDWSGAAVARADTLEQQISSLNSRCRAAEATIHELNTQIEELIYAKVQHENQLIANFVQLLNEKKLKIRNQQRLLASATVDPAKITEIQTTDSGRIRTPARKRRSAKRGTLELIGNDLDDSDGFEKMEIDEAEGVDVLEKDRETDDGQRSTPQPLEEEDNTTNVDYDPSIIEKREDKGPHESASKVSVDRLIQKMPPTAPPRRELPFARRTRQAELSKTERDAEETAGETDDDDDEL